MNLAQQYFAGYKFHSKIMMSRKGHLNKQSITPSLAGRNFCLVCCIYPTVKIRRKYTWYVFLSAKLVNFKSAATAVPIRSKGLALARETTDPAKPTTIG